MNRTSIALPLVFAFSLCVPVSPMVGAERAGAVLDPAVPALRTHRYRLGGRIRPLLFWIGRDDVGMAKVVWRGDADQRGYEFLVGTDPAKAPRAINRWGYIAERSGPGGGSVLAVMSKSDEGSLGEVQSSVDGPPGGVEFKAMEASTRDGVLSWRVARVPSDHPLTIHELSPLLGRVRAETASAVPRSRTVPRDTRAGFLLAVAELVDRSVASAQKAPVAESAVPYVFGQQSYELRVAASRRVTLPVAGRAAAVTGLACTYEILNVASSERTRFDMTVATEGDLAGVPLFIAWQPRWWLKVELSLVE